MTSMTADAFRILVADDERAVLDAYRTVLCTINPPSGKGSAIESLEAKLFGPPSAVEPASTFSPVLCRGGEEAVETIRSRRPEDPAFPVAFLDVRMPPGIDGIETAARIRALDPEINIVIVTGYSDSHPREIAQRVPPLDKLFYISKPFQKMELQQFVLALTAKWKSDRASRLLNQELSRRCQELEVAHAEVVTACERAEFANHTKSEFLANMSHELRTPLNAVIGFTDIMRAEAFGPIGNDRYREYLDDIYYSGKHLLQMINDLLDLSTIEIGKLRISIESISLDDVIGGVASLMRIQAEQAEIELRQEHRAQRVRLRADEHRLRQVLVNLLSNAIKFTPKSGHVIVATDIDSDGNLSISVSDTGIGMSPSDLSLVFAPFQQIDQVMARRYGGAGLGLTIAKNLTELQGGGLTLASELGKGTTVTLRFPPDHYSVKSELYLVAKG
jgi:two-component system, cell cycle sensor histidine kinase PleC